MEKKIRKISVELSLIILIALITARVLSDPSFINNITTFLTFLLQIIIGGTVGTLIAMTFNRLITARWGVFWKGFILFLIITSLFENLLFIQSLAVQVFLLVFLTGAGIFLFITNGSLWDFSYKSVLLSFAAILLQGKGRVIKKIRLPYSAALVIAIVITLSCACFFYIKDRNFINTLLVLLSLAVSGAIFTLLGMVINRLITTFWGDYSKGWPVFQVAAGLYFYFFLLQTDVIKILFFIVFYGIGLLLFINYGKLWVYSSPDNMPLKEGEMETRLNVTDILRNITSGAFKKIAGVLSRSVKNSYFKIAAAIIIFILILVAGVQIFNKYFIVNVKSYSPTRTVTLKTSIRLILNDKVSLKTNSTDELIRGNLTEYTNVKEVSNVYFLKPDSGILRITPEIKGTWRFEEGNTFIFTPEEELKPSTEYRVTFNPEGLYKKGKIIIGKSFSFSTVKFEVTGMRVFFTYDLLSNLENEIVGEINFNFPVDINELENNLSMRIDGGEVKFKLEASTVKTRFYIKSDQVQRGRDERLVVLKVLKGIRCISGGKGLDMDYSQVLILPAKENLTVIDAKTWPVSGNTYIVLLFNRPVSSEQIRQNVRIVDEKKVKIPFTVETEYCYAVLKADFKPEQTYEVIASKGLIAEGGLELSKEFRYEVTIRDLPPAVEFSSGGNVLPVDGNMDIELSTINLDSFRVKVDKIYRNNLVYFLKHPRNSEYAKTILYKTYGVEGGELNEKVYNYINLKKFHKMEYKGLFRISLSDARSGDSTEGEDDEEGYKENNQSKVVLCTDLGIFAKNSGKDLIVNVYSIMKLVPLSDVTVRLVSGDNQVMAIKKTDAAGQVIFENWKEGGEEKFLPQIIIAEKEEDFSYLEFSRSQKDQSRFSIGGKFLSKSAMQAFITPERGVYRPGDRAYISAVVRNGDLSLPLPIVVNLDITDPTGLRFGVYRKLLSRDGLISFEVAFPSFAKTGEYNALLKIGNGIIIGRTALNVEEFIPDKIEVNIKAEDKHTNAEEPLSFKVTGIQLFGPPAAGNRVRTQVKFVSRDFSCPQFKGYTFSDLDRRYDGEFFDLGEENLNDRGEKDYNLMIPFSVMPPSALYAQIFSEVYDEGGRPVSSMKAVAVDRYPVYFGIKTAAQGVYLIKEPVALSLATVNSSGEGVSISNVSIFIKHRVYYSIFRQYGQNEDYESQYYDEPVLHEIIRIDKVKDYQFVPKSAGYYFIYLGNEDSMRSSVAVYVQGPGLETMDQTEPENLNVSLNKEKYEIGDTAVAVIRSAIPGKLFFTIEREKVLYSRVIDLVDNKAVVSFPILAEYLPNVYVSSFVIRRPDPDLKKMPMSALGIKELEIKPGGKRLTMDLSSQDKTTSRRGLDVRIRVQGSSPDCGVVLAAVDDGILQITQFKTPDPFSFFYGKRALETSIYSIFDAVLPDIKAAREAIGGDEAESRDDEKSEKSRRHVNPVAAIRVRPVALYSGILKPDGNGIVNYHFNIPQFNGRLRIMAFSADGDRFGSSSKYVTVSDPFVMSYSLPRVMAPGDSVELPVRIYNQSGSKAEISVVLRLEGPVVIKGSELQKIILPDSGQGEIHFNIRALDNAGKAVFRFEASSGAILSENSGELAVRPPRAVETVTRYGEIAAHGSTSVRVPGGYYPFGREVRFSASPREITKFLGAMEYLLRYPYGCSEQIASSAFPLIYYKDLAQLSGFFSEQSISADYFIQEAIKKLEGMLLPGGEFAIWPGGNEFNHYNSLYITHFLFEADLHGYNVDPNVMEACETLIGLNGPVNTARLDRRGVEDNGYVDMTGRDPYKLYLRALIGKPDRENMDYLRLNKLKNMNYIDRCRLAGAYALTGDRDTAMAVLPSSFALEYFPHALGGDYDSYVKRLSIYLQALCSINREDGRVRDLINLIEKSAQNGNFGSTHDNEQALAALAEAYGNDRSFDVNAGLFIDNKLLADIRTGQNVYKDPGLSGKTLMIINRSDRSMYYNIYIEGVPMESEANPVSKGIVVRREYFDRSGKPLNLSSVEQGELAIATITLKTSGKLDNLVIADLLPAGFEIENPRLNSRGQLGWQPSYNWQGVYEDIRDDRIIIFTGPLNGEFQYSYTVRAVTAGNFIIPQIYSEAMYAPEIMGIGERQGRLNVVRINK